ncbi:MAG: hypothetical protein J6T37_09345 [Bacteroidales bacterium]|nr:hypothetical protein [Bacteroidales bacterium]MBO7530064.1 hypothetical protein [Bacteroidales bacterium]MBQ3845189.1 hypothetical protein [Bacteroidales bacterium]
MNKFIKHLCILTLIIIVASICAHSILTIWWPAIVGFFFIVSMVVFSLSEKAKKKDMRKFANFYMASTVVKMMVYLTIIFVYAINFKADGKRFAITFLAYYLIYSVFETFKLAKKDKKTDGKA